MKRCVCDTTKTVLVIWCVLLCVLPPTPVIADDLGEDSLVQFNVPEQRVDLALTQFAEQASITLLFPSDVAGNLRANRLVGEYSVSEGANILLAGTGLIPTFKHKLVLNIVLDRNKDNAETDMTTRETTRGALLAAVLGLFGASGTQAEDSAQAAASEPVIEEITVTAQKRTESVDDVPIAINVVTGEVLAEVGIDNLRDLQQLETSLHYGEAPNNPFVSMRGIGFDLYQSSGEPSVVVHVDGVPMLKSQMLSQDLLDIERVEVLKGPQGTISGRNATGGAINLHSAAPTDEFTAGFKVTAGNYDRWSQEGFVSGPIGDRVLGRVAFSNTESDGWLSNTLLGQDLGDRDLQQLKGTLLFRLTDSLDLSITGHAIDNDSNTAIELTTVHVREDTPLLSDLYGVPGPDVGRGEFQADTPSYESVQQRLGVARLTWDIGSSATLVSTTSYVHYDKERGWDCDALNLNICDYPAIPVENKQFTQELTLTMDVNEKLDLIVGGLYIDDESVDYVEFQSEDGIGVPGLLLAWTANQDLKSTAVYGQLRYMLTDRLRLSLGARYTKDEKDTWHDESFPTQGVFSFSDSETTPRIALDYNLNDDWMLYASATQGFKAGGISMFTVLVDYFDSEFVDSFEIGAKGRLADDRVRLTASMFLMDYTDLQLNIWGSDDDNDGIPGFSIVNAGESDILGIEVGLQALPTERLSLDAGFTWLDHEINDVATIDPINPELGVFDPVLGVNIVDLAGNELPRSPEWQVALSARYEAPLTDALTGMLRADYKWRSEAQSSIFNRPLTEIDSYGLLNLRARLELSTSAGLWSLDAFVLNATDELYLTHVIELAAGLNPIPYGTAGYGMPRTYGVTVGFNFQ